jgi:hypothetical protein
MSSMDNNCFRYMKNHQHNFQIFYITFVFLNPLIFSLNLIQIKLKFHILKSSLFKEYLLNNN